MNQTLESLKQEIEELLKNYLIYGKVSVKIETEPKVIEFNIDSSTKKNPIPNFEKLFSQDTDYG